MRKAVKRPVIVAPNGVSPWHSSESSHREAREITRGCRYALYCASAHPPNMTGFFEIFGGGFGSLKPNERLVIAGGAGGAIVHDGRIHKSAKLAERVVAAGVVSSSCLAGLLDGASCIVLPLTSGGGTNLKTAEALWSGKYVLATSVAMRGFEAFLGSRGVFVTDDPSEFKRNLRRVMGMPPLVLTQAEIESRRTLLWSRCLAPLPKLVSDLVGGLTNG